MPVKVGEHDGEEARVGSAAGVAEAVHEHALAGNEDVVEDGQGLHVADMGDGSVDMRPLVAKTGERHQLDSRPVRGDGERHGVGVVLAGHEAGGRRDDLVDVGRRGIAGLGSADHDAVGPGLDDSQVHVRVGLLEGPLEPVALDVGLGAVRDDVVLLDPLQVLDEVLVEIGAQGLVFLVGHDRQGVQGVDAHAALDAAAHAVREEPGHLLLGQKIFLRLVDVGEAIDGLAGEVGFRSAEVGVLGVMRAVKSLSHDVHARMQPGILPVDYLVADVDIRLHREKSLFVLLIRSDAHRGSPWFRQRSARTPSRSPSWKAGRMPTFPERGSNFPGSPAMGRGVSEKGWPDSLEPEGDRSRGRPPLRGGAFETAPTQGSLY